MYTYIDLFRYILATCYCAMHFETLIKAKNATRVYGLISNAALLPTVVIATTLLSVTHVIHAVFTGSR